MHFSPDFASPFAPTLFGTFVPFLALLALWSILVKGYALWIAARANQVWWFVALLVINTVGILEVIYLIFFSPPGSNKLNPHKRQRHASHAESSVETES